MDDINDRDTFLLVRTAIVVRLICRRSIPEITNIQSVVDAFAVWVLARDVEAAINRLCALGFMREVTSSSVRVFTWVGQ